MDARTFLKHYEYDERLINGQYYPSEAIRAEKGDTIGVVLMNLGGPEKVEDVEPFLYNLFMDPAIIDMPLGGIFRHWLSRLISSARSKKVGKDYELIGGGSPINHLTREQAQSLESALNRLYGQAAGVTFKVYIAMRYWRPTSEEAAKKMKADGVKKVVLLPLYPHYSKTTTGSSLVYWWMLEELQEIPAWPTTYVYEYATHPKFIRAISARIDEAIAKFPESGRDDLQLLFSAHGTPLYEMKKRRDPYCCLIHATVERVMAYRKNDLPYHIAFQSKVGPAEWLTPSTPDKLKELGEKGHKSVLLIPVAFVTDHIETAYELDIQIREEASHYGIENYAVTGGLNSHPDFIEALAEAAASQIILPAEGKAAPYRYSELKRVDSSQRKCRCHQCEYITEALSWQTNGEKSDQETAASGRKP